jgi:hypothetical protein
MTVDTLGPQLQKKLHNENYEMSQDVDRTILIGTSLIFY